MKLTHLSLKDFRGFDKLDLHLEGKTTVIVGVNGAGKSSIIHAAVTALSVFIDELSYGVSKKVALKETDIKNDQPNYLLEASVMNEGIFGQTKIVKTRAKTVQSKSQSSVKKFHFEELIQPFRTDLENDIPRNLPVAVYYSAARNVIDVPLRIKNRHAFDQFSAYLNCFDTSTDFRTFFEWFRDQEDLENEEKLETDLTHKDPQLEAVRQAIYGMMPGFTDLKIMRKGKMRMVISKNGQRLEISQLSDGEKCTLAMIGDLARRLALANPYLDNPLAGEGIVLIDEIELHLHPAWQREIIKRLEGIFPNIQFIISTHSPQVLGEIEQANIYVITDQSNANDFTVELVGEMFGKDSNLILEEYMNASSKNEQIKSQLAALHNDIAVNNLDAAQQAYEQLVAILGHEDPSLLKAAVIMKRKRMMGKWDILQKVVRRKGLRSGKSHAEKKRRIEIYHLRLNES